MFMTEAPGATTKSDQRYFVYHIARLIFLSTVMCAYLQLHETARIWVVHAICAPLRNIWGTTRTWLPCTKPDPERCARNLKSRHAKCLYRIRNPNHVTLRGFP